MIEIERHEYDLTKTQRRADNKRQRLGATAAVNFDPAGRTRPIKTGQTRHSQRRLTTVDSDRTFRLAVIFDGAGLPQLGHLLETSRR